MMTKISHILGRNLFMPDERIIEAKYKFMHRCDECPKAHDFTCSGAEAQSCTVAATNALKTVIEQVNSEKK